jgi:hypothetical protein
MPLRVSLAAAAIGLTLAAWRTAVQPVEAQWAEGVRKAGADPEQVLDSLKASLARYRSTL